ncbi:MAG: O-antigen ligase family protein [Patescibacteria group bacterium]
MLFYLFLLIFPFQTRILLKSRGAEFIEWNSAFFYLSDVFIAGFVLFWLTVANFPFFNMYNVKRAFGEIWRKTKEAVVDNALLAAALSGFFVISALSLAAAGDKEMAFFSILRLAEFILFFFAVSYILPFFDFKKILLVLLIAGVLQGIVADWQWHTQADLGLKIFGESPLDLPTGQAGAGIAGVAKIDLSDGSKLIRPYGTFPHPNVLAAFILLCLFSLYYLFLSFGVQAKKIVLTAGFLAYFFLTYVLFLTFSRLAISSFIAGSLLFFAFVFWEKKRAGKSLKLIITLFCAFLAAVSFFAFIFSGELSSRSVSLNEQSVSLRLDYAKAALAMAKERPLSGVGAGNFVRTLPNYLPPELAANGLWVFQPVHNIYLLILAETGLFALVAFVFFLSRIGKLGFENLKKQSDFAPFFVLFFIFLALGFFDHYFLTIQQGRIIFWLLLAVIAKNFKEDYNKDSPERKSRS